MATIIDTETGALVKERTHTYGEYRDNAKMMQYLKDYWRKHPNWARLNDMHREALDMFALKISRIFTGDPNHKDNWDDIAGYARLVSDRINVNVPNGGSAGGAGAFSGAGGAGAPGSTSVGGRGDASPPIGYVQARNPPLPLASWSTDNLQRRYNELDKKIATYPRWGAALPAMDGERRDIRRELIRREFWNKPGTPDDGAHHAEK